MQIHLPCYIGTAILLVLLMSGCSTTSVTRLADGECKYIAESGYINVLTINLLFSEMETRPGRLTTLARFIADNQVDLILLQEVVGGTLVNTKSSARDLKNLLAIGHGLEYNLSSIFETGDPGSLAINNATLSTCKMPFLLAKELPGGVEITFRGEPVKVGRDVLMTRLEVPGFGTIRAYNIHLCSACDIAERKQQLDSLLAYIDGLETYVPGRGPTLVGGSFNIDLFRSGGVERYLYNRITAAGFSDTYATHHGGTEGLCEQPMTPDDHCTVGITELADKPAGRIDYLFQKGFGATRKSRVVLSAVTAGEDTVSDHAAVLSRLTLPK